MLWFITFTDYSQDYALYLGPTYGVAEVSSPFNALSSVLVGLLLFAGIVTFLCGRSGYRAQKEIRLFIILFMLSTLWGILVGAIKDVPLNYLIGDSRNTACYIMLFAIAGALKYLNVNTTRRILILTGLILFTKLVIAVLALALLFGGGFSWKYLLKLSNFFPLMLFVALSQFVISNYRRDKFMYAGFALMAAFGIFAAQARGIFLGTLVGGIVLSVGLFRQKNSHRLVMLIILILCIGLGAGYYMQGDIAKSFGYWGENDESYTTGLDYRSRQANMLLVMFKENWLAGAGLGSYDPTFEGYEEWLPRPYLVELEFNNLLAKLGVVGFSLWIGAFISLIIGCIRSARRSIILRHRMFIYSLTAGLISLMVQSAVQTGYSSISFHLFVVFMLFSLSLGNRGTSQLKMSNANIVHIPKGSYQ